MREDIPAYYSYWGKASEDGTYHLLPYHCLDVAAVAEAWLDTSPGIRKLLLETNDMSPEQMKAWVLFFVALHDYGKLDIRFQLKAPKVVEAVYSDFHPELVDIDGMSIKKFKHGTHGFSLFYFDYQQYFGWSGYDDLWIIWSSWLAAVTGHHGSIPKYPEAKDETLLQSNLHADEAVIDHDLSARMSWVSSLEALFLKPAGLSLHDTPPAFNPLLSGFCSVVDWIGSQSEEGGFEFQVRFEELLNYYQKRLPIAGKLLNASGLLGTPNPYLGVSALLPTKKDVKPRQLQLLVDELPTTQGLTLVEAPTGSGKTETALAYAWKLLAEGLADNIIFALPTQATANAMLKRLEIAADTLFRHQPNLVLAHGKSSFNDDFWKIRSKSKAVTHQGEEEAGAQCAQWLSSSRKRAFLGQIGVCTVDQVLISVLPVRHKFVRNFGVGKSILIIDEVHACDSYMYGLLEEVLRQQRKMGGSALLLSATLPHRQKSALAKSWNGVLHKMPDEPYPLLTHVGSDGNITPFTLAAEHLPEERAVMVETLPKLELLADDGLFEQMIQAAKEGAQVVLICNLVDVAQKSAKRLRQMTDVNVDLFHARYRFCDRQNIEKKVLDRYGKNGARREGRILVATQVVEQSLDLDFDWMITQLCPIDLLFQRLGRLHRHEDRLRPKGYEQPCCTVLVPNDEDYGYHELIYGNSRVLWRTNKMLQESSGKIVFPDAYREWIEKVYQEDEWGNEPPAIVNSYNDYLGKVFASVGEAKNLINSDIKDFNDQDANITVLTRDGEMSLNILPVSKIASGNTLLEDNKPLTDLERWWKDEAINLNLVSVPHSWRKKGFLPQIDNGLIQLPLIENSAEWAGEFHGVTIRYSKDYGLEKEDSNA